MISSKSKTMASKILAGFLALIMLVSVIPLGTLVTAFAATIDSYTVSLTDGADIIALDDVKITIKNKNDVEKVLSQSSKNGIATFNNFIEEDETYIVFIDSIVGYKNVADFEITPTAGESNTDVALTAIGKITISGKVVDENDVAYSGASVAISGYTNATTTTNASGEYSFEAYEAQNYTIKATAKEEKYEEKTTTITNPTKDYTCDTLKFTVKQFTIATTAGENGTVTSTESVEYGSNKVVKAVANDGYRIESYKVDGQEQSAAKGEKEYAYTFSNITEAHKVDVSFVRQTYKITFTVSENGKVTYNDGTAQEVAGGSVNIEKIFNESTDPANPTKIELTATPNANYRVSQVIVDNGKPETFSENDKTYTKEFEMTKDHSFVVEFKLNTYTVKTIDGENGYSTVDKTIVDYDGTATITITPDNGYNIETVEVNGVATSAYTITSDEDTYKLVIENIIENTDVVITYSQVPTISMDNVMLNTDDVIKVDDSEGNTIKYVFANNGKAVFTTTKNGIRINGDRSTGVAFNNPKWEITKSTLVTKIEVYSGLKWSKVDLSKNIQIVIDKDAPTVKPDKDVMDWTNSNQVTITGSVSDTNTSAKPSSGLSHIIWSKDATMSKDEVLAATSNKVKIESDGTYLFDSVKGEQNSIYYIYAVDIAGNVSDAKSVNVRIDQKKPTVTAFTYSTSETSVVEDFIKFLTFGTVSSKSIYVTVTGSDEDITSGLKEITLYKGSDVFETKTTTGNTATFKLTEAEFKNGAEISATATDIAGNVSNNTKPTDEGVTTKAKNNTVKIDIAKPEATIQPDEAVYTDGDGKLWYNGNTALNIVATDNNAGICSVEIKLNGESLKTDVEGKAIDTDFSAAYTTSEKFVINTAQNAVDGENVIEVIVTNNAGVQSETKIQKVYIDTTAPDITNFEVTRVGGKALDKILNFLTFGIFFNDQVEVTVTAADSNATAGVKSITYYTVDIDSGKSEEITELVNKDNCIDFTIKANFKGQIYAKATDNVLNVASDFVNPDSAIVESPEKHEKEEHIAFSKSPTEYKTQDETELYSKDVPVTLTVTDTYSGIRNIEWEVVAPYDTENNQSGKVSVNNDKTFGEGSDTDWKQTKTESNLVTEMQKTITVNNNSNDIVVLVKMTDRAGNTSEKQIKFSIDKTNPVIEVEYDNNVPDETYKDIFKANRTATIKITERNFNGKDVIHRITNTDGVIPALSAWEEHKNTENPDETYYTATIAYTADGDYTFDISYSDLADNAAEKFAQHKFTIDKTIPTVVVSYDNNSALNGNYYKADRTATITIVEHNFDSSRVNVVGTATDNGTALSFPATSTWTSNGDTHTATINYSSDSKYTFDIEFLDMAGNPIADYTTEEFFVDKTAPTLEISGVADKSANNGTVAPVVTYSDTNFNKDAVNIELSGVSNGKVNYAGSAEDIANGQKFTYADFEKVQNVDDIYTLTATLTDMAGNETTKTIVFSANRFGSVYTFDSFLKSIEGKYTNTEQDVVFTETNVDTLDRESIKLKLVKNGTPSDLKEGNDYTITTSGGNGQWSQYKYVVNKALFADDGNYRLTIYSMDAAGNVNENIDESKKAEISFGIDKTNPVIVPIDFESGKQYPVEVKNVKAEVKDNLVLESVKIYLNGEEVEYMVDGEVYTFDIPEANEKQNVEFVAVDAAGNEYKLQVDDFLVSTNIFVRWYNNTPLFVGSIIGVVVLAVAITAFILFGKKKKKDEEK